MEHVERALLSVICVDAAEFSFTEVFMILEELSLLCFHIKEESKVVIVMGNITFLVMLLHIDVFLEH